MLAWRPAEQWLAGKRRRLRSPSDFAASYSWQATSHASVRVAANAGEISNYLSNYGCNPQAANCKQGSTQNTLRATTYAAASCQRASRKLPAAHTLHITCGTLFSWQGPAGNRHISGHAAQWRRCLRAPFDCAAAASWQAKHCEAGVRLLMWGESSHCWGKSERKSQAANHKPGLSSEHVIACTAPHCQNSNYKVPAHDERLGCKAGGGLAGTANCLRQQGIGKAALAVSR